ncbi:hypothetical protein [Ideonella sp. BN130291]|uniref:hypothetical protein n=1 Tax=Ideonella sp. BN130291 TaxID=3112940 RepID=UPI002E270B0F|nr:hypothetical protein [Ideonella sp. BN130291]
MQTLSHPSLALVDGAARDTLTLALRTLELAEQAGAAPTARLQALALVARAYRGLGALSQAESYLQQALRWADCVGGADAGVDLLCELAELAVQRADGCIEDDPVAARLARERARDLCFDAAARASRTADAQWEVHVLLRVSDVLDRSGDRHDAISLQCRALQLLVQYELPMLDNAAAAFDQTLM